MLTTDPRAIPQKQDLQLSRISNLFFNKWDSVLQELPSLLVRVILLHDQRGIGLLRGIFYFGFKSFNQSEQYTVVPQKLTHCEYFFWCKFGMAIEYSSSHQSFNCVVSVHFCTTFKRLSLHSIRPFDRRALAFQFNVLGWKYVSLKVPKRSPQICVKHTRRTQSHQQITPQDNTCFICTNGRSACYGIHISSPAFVHPDRNDVTFAAKLFSLLPSHCESDGKFPQLRLRENVSRQKRF
eukprot:Gregarina_sp_Poly_1__4304@NODE_2339_length_2260_cov_358_553580_g1495_i0_p1_GENE_NODE_2339_length_2260_cov_358_553580_g1495_i0NODE_2339_length_2260_cov_358_553580_g1495_i0_p1_ORF_typecomplete_len238_score17_21_NODE_2339_length_2260_cov_358_553580_g1495_i06361349